MCRPMTEATEAELGVALLQALVDPWLPRPPNANMAHAAPVAEGGRMVQPGGGGWSDRVVGREGAIWVVGWSDST